MTLSIQTTDKVSPYTPFRKIRKVCANSELWASLLLRAGESYDFAQQRDLVLTSCIANFNLLNVLFVGKEHARKVMFALTFESELSVQKSPEVPGDFDAYALLGVVSGIAILKQNKRVEIPEFYFNEQEAIRTSTTLGIKFIRCLEQAKTSQDYAHLNGFNRKVIASLEAEMAQNAAQVSKRCSFIYHVYISTPCDPVVSVDGSREDVKASSAQNYHSFIFEQYYSRETGHVFVRLHQSWITVITLAEHYEKMEFGDYDEGCFDQEGLSNFFKNFRSLFLCEEDVLFKSFKQLGKFQAACFNVPAEPILPPGIFRRKDGIICGTTVRYITSKVRPKSVLKNFTELLSSTDLV